MEVMECSERNIKIVKSIIQILAQNEVTVKEAYGILDNAKLEITYASKVKNI